MFCRRIRVLRPLEAKYRRHDPAIAWPGNRLRPCSHTAAPVRDPTTARRWPARACAIFPAHYCLHTKSARPADRWRPTTLSVHRWRSALFRVCLANVLSFFFVSNFNEYLRLIVDHRFFNRRSYSIWYSPADVGRFSVQRSLRDSTMSKTGYRDYEADRGKQQLARFARPFGGDFFFCNLFFCFFFDSQTRRFLAKLPVGGQRQPETSQVRLAVGQTSPPRTGNNPPDPRRPRRVARLFFSCIYVRFVRLQVSLYLELDDLDHFDNSLSDAVSANSRRYANMIADVVQELLPTYKDHEVRPFVLVLDNEVRHDRYFSFFFSISSLKTKTRWTFTSNIVYWLNKDREWDKPTKTSLLQINTLQN